MTRREAREQAFCILFEQAVTGESVEDILHNATEARDPAFEETAERSALDVIPDEFAERVAFGVEERQEEIDEAIRRFLRGWSIHRLSKVTLALLRLAVYEFNWEEDIPVSVSINEAVELAKKYGGKDDAPYVNGVLSSVAKADAGQNEE